MRSFDIRAASEADLPSIEALLESSALPPQGVAEALDGFVVADAGGRIVGVAGLEIRGEAALLRSVAVDSDWRGRGLGAALVDATLDTARTRGVTEIYLLTTTAGGYFPNHGFEPVVRDAVPPSIAETEEFRQLCPASATVMHRRVVRVDRSA
jgi:amino-acid N-acetyltransferase